MFAQVGTPVLARNGVNGSRLTHHKTSESGRANMSQPPGPTWGRSQEALPQQNCMIYHSQIIHGRSDSGRHTQLLDPVHPLDRHHPLVHLLHVSHHPLGHLLRCSCLTCSKKRFGWGQTCHPRAPCPENPNAHKKLPRKTKDNTRMYIK